MESKKNPMTEKSDQPNSICTVWIELRALFRLDWVRDGSSDGSKIKMSWTKPLEFIIIFLKKHYSFYFYYKLFFLIKI